MAFNSSGATGGQSFDISTAFDRVWYVLVLHKLRYYGISGWVFGLISSAPSNRWLCMVGWAALARMSS